VWDLYALWTVSPALGVRLLGSNLDPREYLTSNVTDSVNPVSNARERSTSQSFSSNYVNWQLRLEMKL
jgi:iron complex outermembrane receptor protein